MLKKRPAGGKFQSKGIRGEEEGQGSLNLDSEERKSGGLFSFTNTESRIGKSRRKNINGKWKKKW